MQPDKNGLTLQVVFLRREKHLSILFSWVFHCNAVLQWSGLTSQGLLYMKRILTIKKIKSTHWQQECITHGLQI